MNSAQLEALVSQIASGKTGPKRATRLLMQNHGRTQEQAKQMVAALFQAKASAMMKLHTH